MPLIQLGQIGFRESYVQPAARWCRTLLGGLCGTAAAGPACKLIPSNAVVRLGNDREQRIT